MTLNDVEKERTFKDSIEGREKEYHRLVSFFYPKNCATVLTLKGEENNNGNGKIRDGLSRRKKERGRDVGTASEKVSVDAVDKIPRGHKLQAEPIKGVSRSRYSLKTREFLRQMNLGKKKGPCSEERKIKIGLSNIGKHSIPHSEETKEKLRKPKGPMSEETKEKLRKPKDPMSEEQKVKISKSVKETIAKRKAKK